MTAETRESNVSSDIADPALAEQGVRRIEWAAREMPVIAGIRQRFEREQPLSGVRIAACLHVTSETANLMLTLRDGGADVRLCASNPLSTQDEVAAALVVKHGIPTFAIKGESTDTYREHLSMAVEHSPQLTLDDGADLVALLHGERRDLLDGVAGGTEETTAGLTRERALAKQGALAYPIVAVNDARTKHFFRQPLRHRAVDHRRHHSRDEHPARRQDVRRLRVRLVRPRSGLTRPRVGSACDRD